MIERLDKIPPSKDLVAFLASVSDLFTRLRLWVEANGDQILSVARVAHRNIIFEKAGWLLHHTTPLHLITDDMTEHDITPILEAYYLENWSDIAVAFRNRVGEMNVDKEARAAFEEALLAHGAGLYRAAIRVVFPEIERIARDQLLEGTLEGIASLKEVRQAAGELGWGEWQKFGEDPIFGQFTVMSYHLYEVAKTRERIAQLACSPIPNRHAALHGLIAYTSLQSSVSAIIMAEFMFKAISILRDRPKKQMCGLL